MASQNTRPNDCLFLHPQNSIQDILAYTGMIRHTYEVFEGKLTLLISPVYASLCRKHFKDLTEINIVEVHDFSDSTLLKLFLNQFKANRERYFMGSYDKFRFDSYKKKFSTQYPDGLKADDSFDPYSFYGFDPSIRYSYFRINTCNKTCDKLIKNIKTVANMNFNITSKADFVPSSYKKNAMISLNIDTMFGSEDFFNSIELVRYSKALYLTNAVSDNFTLLLYMLIKSEHYPDLLPQKNVYFFHKKNETIRYNDLPDKWRVIASEN